MHPPPSPPLRCAAFVALLGLSGVARAADDEALTLDQALAAAEKSNTGLALAHEQTVQAQALFGQAWGLLSPKVVADASYTINDKEIAVDFTESIPQDLKDSLGLASDPITLQPKTVWAASASVIQPLFNASSLPLLRAAYKNLEATQDAEQNAREQVRGGVAKVFYGMAVAQGMGELSAKAEESAKHHLELAVQQVAAGMAPERVVIQAEIALSKAQRDRASARQGLINARETFANLTGLPNGTRVVLPDVPVTVPDTATEATRAAYDRPDLKAADAQAAAAGYKTHAERLDWLPTIDGRFTYAYTQNTGFSDDPTVWMLVFKANWTLWDGGYRLAQTQTYASQARQASILVTQGRQNAETEVRVAYEGFERAKQALDAVEREKTLAAENLRLAELSFQSGGLSWLEVEDARLGLLAAEMTALQERANRDLAAIDLRVAIGDY